MENELTQTVPSPEATPHTPANTIVCIFADGIRALEYEAGSEMVFAKWDAIDREKALEALRTVEELLSQSSSDAREVASDGCPSEI